MIIDVITIFPKMFSPVLGESIIKRAQAKGLVKINVHNLRDYSNDRHNKVDAPSYGGGGGMVFRPEPIFEAVEAVLGCPMYPKRPKLKQTRIVFFSPQGVALNQRLIRKFLKFERLVLIAGRYEGIDQRVRDNLIDEEISIGDYVLSGGELAAMVFIDCLSRIIPGVVSDAKSIEQESFEKPLLDFPHYTRPEEFRGLRVPSVLLSGNHVKIDEWRKKKSLEVTKKKRSDLIDKLKIKN
ncbi:MAG: tRNA (guanosine(37)-N1)-methyltransferase TrmD [Candidatus Omnitrophota bacterium]